MRSSFFARSRRWIGASALAILVGLGGGTAFLAASAPMAAAQVTPAAQITSPAINPALGFADLVEAVKPAVVSIIVQGREDAPAGGEFNPQMPDLPEDNPLRKFFEQFGNGNRWNVLRDALIDKSTGIISTLESQVRFGLALYTSENGFGSETPAKTCPMITQVAPAKDNYAPIAAAYLPDDWKGDTPTGESIDAAVKILDGITEAGPKAIVLATDGEPDSCADPNPGDDKGLEAARALSVTAVENAFKKQITTYVISVGNEVGQDHLRAVANAGQGLAVDVDATKRFYLANNQADLATAFGTIINGVRSCAFSLNGTVPEDRASSGSVRLDGDGLLYGDKDGWLLTAPSVVELQGKACAAIKSGNHDLKIDFPCGVIIPIVPK